MQAAIDHLRSDPVLSTILTDFEMRAPRWEPDGYFVLMKSIVSQQLSTKAAATIWGRFLDRFAERYPQPEVVLNMSMEQLRACGLSGQKATYLQHIATFHLEHGIQSEALSSMTDQEVIQYLTQIKGVGKWTVEMLLIFGLARPDVFPVDDLGVRQAMIRLYQLSSEDTKALYKQLRQIAEAWSPYRSYASIALWEWKDGK